MKKINSNIKGDLYIRFKMTLPNYNLLPNDAKNQIRGMLISLDKQQSTESLEETQIKSATNNVKTILCDCNMEQTEQISDLLNKLKENKPRRQRREQEESGQPGCVQQ
jgi:DnaJ-class molecular chaperone